jgi:GxxExxY protein
MNYHNTALATVAYDTITAKDSREDRAVKEVINAAKLIHMELGPGLLEEVYEECLCQILTKREVSFKRNVSYPVIFMGETLDYKLDLRLLVDDCLVVEVRTVGRLKPIHEEKLLTSLKLSKMKQCLLINFKVPLLEQGIKRIIKKGGE